MLPKTFQASDHDIDHSQIDSDALYVLSKLQENGYTAYLVGGSVRDLLLNRSPKDYDISTSAQPEEIKQIFQRKCLLIGKRFRLAHVRFGHKILEVSTFRSGDNDSDLIIRDNTWGSEEEDVIRRDFTMNGLFYDPSTHKIIDYVGGLEDVKKGILRSIGDPRIRFKQDPVRMLRLIKFRARFGFEIEPETKQALLDSKDEIFKSSPARILEEILRMLESGSAARFFHLMTLSGLLDRIFPPLANFLKTDSDKKIYTLLEVADHFNQSSEHRILDRPLLAACLIFPILEKEIKIKFLDKGLIPHLGDIMTATTALTNSIVTSSFTHFPKRISAIMTHIMVAQYRLTPLSGKRHNRNKLVRGKEFPLALMFLKMRATGDKALIDDYTDWRNMYRMVHQQSMRKAHHHNHPPPVPKED